MKNAGIENCKCELHKLAYKRRCNNCNTTNKKVKKHQKGCSSYIQYRWISYSREIRITIALLTTDYKGNDELSYDEQECQLNRSIGVCKSTIYFPFLKCSYLTLAFILSGRVERTIHAAIFLIYFLSCDFKICLYLIKNPFAVFGFLV